VPVRAFVPFQLESQAAVDLIVDVIGRDGCDFSAGCFAGSRSVATTAAFAARTFAATGRLGAGFPRHSPLAGLAEDGFAADRFARLTGFAGFT
jgi:hypothetical protein